MADTEDDGTLYDVDVRTINEHIKKIIQILNLRRIQLFGISE